MSNDIAQDVCKAVRGLGFSPKRTRKIVDGVVSDITNNGPEWVADRIKGLTAYYTGESSFPGWIKKTFRKDGLLRPKGWMGALIQNSSKSTTLAALSTVRGAMVLDHPSLKQLTKWKVSLLDPPAPTYIFTDVDRDLLSHLERDLKKRLSRVEAFGPDDIHGSSIPLGRMSMNVRRAKGKVDLPGLYQAWKGSILTAPSHSWSFQDQSGVRIPGMSVTQARPILNGLRKEAPDSSHKKKPGKRNGRTLEGIQEYPIGHISFLQEPFGKLRTVANPNRFVQWQLTPLGETLSDFINSVDGVWNLDQEGGIRWVQEQLRQGIHLTSADLSSASDTLDFSQVLLGFKDRDVAPELTKHLEYFEWCSKQPWLITSPEAAEFVGSPTIRWKQGQPLGLRPSFPVLSICNYVAAAKAVQDIAGQWDGPMPFAIVGDDIVIHTTFAKRYAEIISELGGVANLDKSMSSSVQAEFCSRLITADDVLRLKARYLIDNGPQNILTYQDRGITPKVPHWQVRMAKRVGAYALVESNSIPNYHPDQPASLREKVLFHAALSLDKGGKTTPMESSLHRMWYAYLEQGPRPIQSIWERVSDSYHSKRPGPTRPRKKRSWVETRLPLQSTTVWEQAKVFRRWNPDLNITRAYARVMGRETRYDDDKAIAEMLDAIRNDPSLLQRIPEAHWIDSDGNKVCFNALRVASAREQKLSPGRTRFDHHVDKRVQISDPSKDLSRLHRKVVSMEKDHLSDQVTEALIQRVGDRIDRLIEVEGQDTYVSFHSPKRSTPRTRVLLSDVPTVAEAQDDYEFDL